MREFCRAQIAHFKVSRYVRVMGAFPLTLTLTLGGKSGKVQKYLIRKRLRAELDLMGDQESLSAVPCPAGSILDKDQG